MNYYSEKLGVTVDPQQNGKNISGGWHSELGVNPPTSPIIPTLSYVHACSASPPGCQRGTARIYFGTRLQQVRGASAGRQLSTDISCSQGAQQQTRRPSLLLSIEGTDGQTVGRTDRHTDGRSFHRPCSTHYELRGQCQ